MHILCYSIFINVVTSSPSSDPSDSTDSDSDSTDSTDSDSDPSDSTDSDSDSTDLFDSSDSSEMDGRIVKNGALS